MEQASAEQGHRNKKWPSLPVCAKILKRSVKSSAREKKTTKRENEWVRVFLYR